MIALHVFLILIPILILVQVLINDECVCLVGDDGELIQAQAVMETVIVVAMERLMHLVRNVLRDKKCNSECVRINVLIVKQRILMM